jgi:hypothetical protein
MIGKAGLVAAIAIAAVASGRSIDMRGLYDQMYPVSTLKRDALDLCHDSDPTFVRAWRGDRVSCYSGMPHAIALALGFIHPSSALAGLFTPLGGGLVGTDSLLAAAGLAGTLTMSREPPLTARLGVGHDPCHSAVAGLDATPARSIDDDKALKMLSDRRIDPRALMPTSVPAQSDSLTLLDDFAPGHGAPALTPGAASAGCGSSG